MCLNFFVGISLSLCLFRASWVLLLVTANLVFIVMFTLWFPLVILVFFSLDVCSLDRRVRILAWLLPWAFNAAVCLFNWRALVANGGSSRSLSALSLSGVG